MKLDLRARRCCDTKQKVAAGFYTKPGSNMLVQQQGYKSEMEQFYDLVLERRK